MRTTHWAVNIPAAFRCPAIGMDFCPLEPDFGSVADWVTIFVAMLALGLTSLGILVSAIGAIAVAYLGVKANTVARQAHAVNERLVDHELRSATEARESEAAERRLLLAELYSAAVVARSGFQLCIATLKLPDAGKRLRNPQGSESLVELLGRSEIAVSDAVRSRLHVIGEPLSGQLVRARGAPHALVTLIEISLKLPPGKEDALVQQVLSGCQNAIADLEALLRAANEAMQRAGLPRVVPLEG